MRNVLTSTFIGTALLLSPVAFAQNNASPPLATNGNTADAPASDDMGMQNGFVTREPTNQLSASNLIGANVMGTENQSIGEVDDMLLDRDGRVTAVTVDVGGFLGIGEKTVAIPLQSLQFVPGATTTSATAATNGTAATGTTTGATATPNTTTTTTGQTMAPQTGMGTAPMGTAPANGVATNSAVFNWGGGRLDHVQVNFTRDQLQNAPEYNDDNG